MASRAPQVGSRRWFDRLAGSAPRLAQTGSCVVHSPGCGPLLSSTSGRRLDRDEVRGIPPATDPHAREAHLESIVREHVGTFLGSQHGMRFRQEWRNKRNELHNHFFRKALRITLHTEVRTAEDVWLEFSITDNNRTRNGGRPYVEVHGNRVGMLLWRAFQTEYDESSHNTAPSDDGRDVDGRLLPEHTLPHRPPDATLQEAHTAAEEWARYEQRFALRDAQTAAEEWAQYEQHCRLNDACAAAEEWLRRRSDVDDRTE